ncbi:MAG: zinc-ribbon domain-containing protein [Anaerolineae bacterium]|nr:zinc-ribbon domain-containing protein [Anaerolineae bacterium]
MLFIIFGTKVRHQVIGEGQFFCPKCQSQRQYKHKKASRYFSLYFVPLIPMGKLGEFVECQTCGVAFEPTVLQIRGPVRTRHQATSTENLAQIINSIPARLNRGVPVEYLARDLTAAGVDRDVVMSMIEPHLGGRGKTCAACGLTYAASVSACSECGELL